MSEWTDYDDAFAGAETLLQSALDWAFTADDNKYAAYVDYMANQDHKAIGHLITAVGNLVRCIRDVTTSASWYTIDSATLFCIDANHEAIDPFVLTWQKICEAWIKDDFEGRAMTIACIDRMRQIIWDEPFFVAWAARPEQQEF